MNRQFENFDLEFSRAAEGYTARVLSSPGGEGSQAFTIPISDLELENVVFQVLAARSVRSISSKPGSRLRNVGGALFKSVFAGEVLQCYLRSLGSYSESGGLRMRLRFVDTPELVNLPWELLYDEGVDQWVALKLDTPLVRYLRMPAKIAPLRVTGPLHVLTVVSNPSDVPALDVESETVAVESALHTLNDTVPGSVVSQTLRYPTPELLQRKLMELPWNVLHFIGHGEFDERTQMGMLVLEDERGKARAITAERLSVMLQGRSLKLVILNSCEGSRGGDDNRSGLTQSLIAQGVPAVIAMQFPITDTAALAFSRMFYHALVLGSSLENAVVEARRAIFQESELEWATPTLYLRSENGLLFERPDPGVLVRAPVETRTSPRIDNDAKKIVPDVAPLRTDVEKQTSTPELDSEPRPKPDPIPLPWWKRPFVIPGGLLALVVLFIAIARLSPTPSPGPSPSPTIADLTTLAPILATREPAVTPVASSRTALNAFSRPLSSSALRSLFATSASHRPFGTTCPMSGARTSDTFDTDTHVWDTLPSDTTIRKGFMIVTPPRGQSQHVLHHGSMTSGTICATVEMNLSDPSHRASDDSAAGLSFWENAGRYWTFFITSNGKARVGHYDVKSRSWTVVLRTTYAARNDFLLGGEVITARLAGRNATFYVNGMKIGSVSGGPSGSTQSGVIAETATGEPQSIKWHFGAYGVTTSI